MQPVTKLVPSVFPRQVVRATILGDVMKNYGLPDSVIQIAQAGFMAGDIIGVRMTGYAPSGLRRDYATLTFDTLKENDDMTMDVSDGRSMVEALSRKFAHAVAASVHLMRQQRLNIHYTFIFPSHANAANTCQKYGLAHEDVYDDGKLVFGVTPGRDSGIRFNHYTLK